jgi:hypothetical protein
VWRTAQVWDIMSWLHSIAHGHDGALRWAMAEKPWVIGAQVRKHLPSFLFPLNRSVLEYAAARSWFTKTGSEHNKRKQGTLNTMRCVFTILNQ